MSNPLMDKIKHSVFPEIKDWTSPMNHIRYSDDIKEMSFWDWVFFHPSAYKIIMYSFNASNLAIFSFITWYILPRIPILSLVSAFMAINGGVALYKNIKNHKVFKHTTFHDIWFREF